MGGRRRVQVSLYASPAELCTKNVIKAISFLFSLKCQLFNGNSEVSLLKKNV